MLLDRGDCCFSADRMQRVGICSVFISGLWIDRCVMGLSGKHGFAGRNVMACAFLFQYNAFLWLAEALRKVKIIEPDVVKNN